MSNKDDWTENTQSDLVVITPTYWRRQWCLSNKGPNILEEKHAPLLRELCSDCPVHYENPSSPSMNGRDIAQEMVIELTQQEVDEKVSAHRRN